MDSSFTIDDIITLHDASPSAYYQTHDTGAKSDLENEVLKPVDNKSLPAPTNQADSARLKALFDTGYNFGFKAGMSSQLNKIVMSIDKNERQLDTIYNFTPMMIQDIVVPPVITEARDLYNQDGDYVIRLSGASYTIHSQAKFSSTAPNWRGYLTFNTKALTTDDYVQASILKPQTDIELMQWKESTKNGWNQGIEQANILLKYNFDRLNRDFIGMMRFHQFVSENKITLPIIAKSNFDMTKTQSTMTVDETLLQLTVLSEFDDNIGHWRSSVTTSKE